MQPVNNNQFTEDQRAEAYRVESMQQMLRQTKALETLRTIAVVFTILFVVGVVIVLFSAANGF